jgi:hypothetical protein
MAITTTMFQTTGPASAAGTQLGQQVIAAPASWTELATLGVIPGGGCKLTFTSDAEAFRYMIMPPSAAAVDPRNNGVLVPGIGVVNVEIPEEGGGSRVWVKQA